MKKNIKINYILNLSYQLLVIILPIITTPYVSRVLGAEGVGAYSYTLSITTYFILFGCVGLGLYGQREIAYYQNDSKSRTKVFYELLILKVLTMSVSIIAYCFMIENMALYKTLMYIQLIDLIGNMIDITYFFQGLEEFKKIVTRNVIIKLIGIICIFTLVKTADDLPKYVAIYSVSLLIGNISMWLLLPKYLVRIKLKNLSIKKHLQATLVLFLPQIAISIYTVLDRTMIGIITDNVKEIGYYEQAQKIIKLALTIVTSLGAVMLPRVANLFAENKRVQIKYYIEVSFRFVFMVGFPIMFGLMGIASNLIPWFLGSEFLQSETLLVLSAPLIIFIGISNVIGLQYLIATRKQKTYIVSTIMGAIINFLLNLVLIPILLSTGATIASLVAEFSVAAFQIFCVWRQFDFIKVFKQSIKYLLSAVVMFSILKILSVFMPSTFVYSFILISIGGVVYTLMLILLKDSFVLDFLKKIIKRGKTV